MSWENAITNPGEGSFGESTEAELMELRKALDIGYTQPVTGTGFDALRTESLESTLRILTYRSKDIKFWNMIPKLDAYSTVEEYNRLLQYGSEGGGFVASGQLPPTEDSTYERADQKVKYLGTTREVNHPATLVRTVPADLIAQETENGALWMMGKINRGLLYADSDAIPLEFNSVPKQIIEGAGTVIDMRGAPLSKDQMDDAIQVIDDNFGQATDFLSNSKVFTDFGKTLYGQQRLSLGEGGVVGTPITGYKSLLGNINFAPDKFVKRGSIPPATATSAYAPPAPTVSLSVQAATVVGSLFGTADAGVYKFQVTAINNYGESAPSALSAGQTVTAAGSITLSITDGGGIYPATCYKIYRTDKAGTVTNAIYKLVPRHKTAGVYDSPTSWVDLNAYLPATFIGLVLSNDAQCYSFKQLSPMIKMPLAQISPSIRWMQLLYGTPLVYAPKKHVVFINIGVQS